MPFRTLAEALRNLNPGEIIIAQDVSPSGQKCFLKGARENLESIYTDMKDRHWYECLVEHRPSRIFLDVESLTHVEIENIVDICRKAIRLKFSIEADIKVLDSCSDKKYSWHVLCANLYLKNIYHVGAFVRRLVLSMVGHPARHAIDTAVYTKNRMFRVAGSSKFGSTRILTHPTDTWSELLVQAENATYEECNEIDGSAPSSTSLHPDKMFQHKGGVWTRCGYQKRLATASTDTNCPMLVPILDWLDKHVHAQTCRHNTSLTETGHYRISTRSKRCAIANREHKGNNIWFDVNVNRGTVHQRCYDDECRSHAVPVAVPAEHWSRWNGTWSEVIHAPMNENTLFNMSM